MKEMTGNFTKPLVSIIIPMYNLEGHISACIESVQAERYVNYEIILVDDGSTDNTVEVCRELQRSDDRIVIVTQDNRGVSAARNRGLEIAGGEYIVFIDGDDMVTEDHLQRLVGMIHGYGLDWVTCGFEYITDTGDGVRREYCYSFDRDVIVRGEDARRLAFKSVLSVDPSVGNWNIPSCCTGIYSREFLKNHDLKLPEGIDYGEDLMMNRAVSLCLDGFGAMKDPLYQYINRAGSASAANEPGQRMKQISGLIQTIDDTHARQGDTWDVLEKRYIFGQIADYLNNMLLTSSREQRRDCIANLKTWISYDTFSGFFNIIKMRDAVSVREKVLIKLLKSGRYELIYTYYRVKSLTRIK